MESAKRKNIPMSNYRLSSVLIVLEFKKLLDYSSYGNQQTHITIVEGSLCFNKIVISYIQTAFKNCTVNTTVYETSSGTESTVWMIHATVNILNSFR